MKLADRLALARGEAIVESVTHHSLHPDDEREVVDAQGAAETAEGPDVHAEETGTAAPMPARTVSSPETARAASPVMPDALAGLKRRVKDELMIRIGSRGSDPSLSEDDLKAFAREQLADIVKAEQVPMSTEERDRLIRQISDDVLGYGPLQSLLEDDTVTEIMVNGPDQVFIEQKGKVTLSGSTFTSEEQLRNVIERIVTQVGRRIDESSPLVDARLPDGSRVNAVIPPLAVNGSSLTIRKFAADPLKVDDLIRFGSITPQMAELLQACVEAHLNILVAGGTGTGKTTMLNVMSSFIPHGERIVTIEDAVELQLQQEHVVRLESRPANIEGKGEISIRDLLKNSLRMRPDRIVVGECRGGEALDMLQAMNTGHDGSLSTIHANSPRDVISRLETLVLMAGMDLPLKAVREQIASAIDVVVQLSRLRDGSRRVTHVTEIQGMEGETVTLQDAFLFDYSAGVDPRTGRFLGKTVTTGVRPKFVDKFEDYGIRLSPSVFTPPGGPVMGALIAGLGLLFAAGLVGLFLVARSRTPRLPMDRRRLPDPAKASKPSQLSRITGITTEAIAEFLERRGWTRKIETALDLAGMRVAPADFLVLVAVGGVVGALFGLVLGGPVLALLFLGLSPLAAKFGLGFLVGRRQKAFGDQLDNTLQLFAGSLRAGHSLLRAVDAVAKESDTPTSEELARVVNETRIGRDLDDAMELTAERMNSEDFSWVAQAIGIHREVGGDLAEVLDRVGATIRERNQIKRQVSALSAEGKMSAYILMALPVVIAGFLTIMAQEFIVKFVTTGIWGYGLMFAALVMFTIGGLWMKKVVTFRF